MQHGWGMGNRDLISVLGTDKKFFSKMSRPVLGLTQPHIKLLPGIFPGVNRVGHEVPTKTEDKDMSSYIPHSSTCSHDVGILTYIPSHALTNVIILFDGLTFGL
jgi:hypothetical protein